MRNEISKILSTYNSILENKKIISLNEIKPIALNTVRYKNVQIDSKASSDSVNKALLDDLQTAAAKANITVTITTASTGHNVKTSSGTESRHGQKTAVDIGLINNIGSGKASSPSNGNTQFRELGNRLKDALVSMGYSLNSESGKDKAVLWQTDIGGNHYNHLHVSNTTDSSTNPSLNNTGSSTSGGNTTATSATTGVEVSNYGSTNSELGKLLGAPFEKTFGESLKESKIYGEFGKEPRKSFGTILLPKEKNEKIKSPVDGIVVRGRYNTSCLNQMTIEHEVNNKTFYLEYCGISRPSVSTSSKVSVGTVLGKTDNDVEITLYDSSYTKINIDSLTNSATDNKKYRKQKFNSEPEYSRPNVFGKVVGNIIATPIKWFEDKYDENGNRIEKRWGSATEKEQPTDWLNQLSPTYKKKVKEDIERIKKML
jgi:hypothetical protein